MKAILTLACLAQLAQATITYSNNYALTVTSGISTQSVSNGNGDAVISTTLNPAAGESYVVTAEYCADGLCTGQVGIANPTGLLRLTNLSITCESLTPTCNNQVLIQFFGSGSGLDTTVPTTFTGTFDGTQDGSDALTGEIYYTVFANTDQVKETYDFTTPDTGAFSFGPFSDTIQAHQAAWGSDGYLRLMGGLANGATFSLPNSLDIQFSTPEPSGFLLLGSGLLIAAGVKRLRRSRR